MSVGDMGIDRALLGELPFYPESAILRRGLRDRDYTRNGRGSRARLKPQRRAEYIGVAENPVPLVRGEHVLPFKGNDSKPRGAFSVLVDAVLAGEIDVESLPAKVRRNVKRTIARVEACNL